MNRRAGRFAQPMASAGLSEPLTHDLFTLDEDHEHDGWATSYADILTLVVTLLVVLLALFTQFPQLARDSHPPAVADADTSRREVVAAEPASGVPSAVAVSASIAPEPAPIREVQREAVTPAAAEPAATPEIPPPSVIVVEALPTEDMPGHVPALERIGTGEVPAAPLVPVTNMPATDLLAKLQRWHEAIGLGGQVELALAGNDVELKIGGDLLFPSGRAALQPQGTQVLQQVLPLLLDNAYAITVAGHTDAVPIRTERFRSNWELSAIRATTIASYLIEHGVAPARVSAVGYGATRPVSDNATPAGQEKNRRVVISLRVPAESGEGL